MALVNRHVAYTELLTGQRNLQPWPARAAALSHRLLESLASGGLELVNDSHCQHWHTMGVRGSPGWPWPQTGRLGRKQMFEHRLVTRLSMYGLRTGSWSTRLSTNVCILQCDLGRLSLSELIFDHQRDLVTCALGLFTVSVIPQVHLTCKWNLGIHPSGPALSSRCGRHDPLIRCGLKNICLMGDPMLVKCTDAEWDEPRFAHCLLLLAACGLGSAYYLLTYRSQRT